VGSRWFEPADLEEHTRLRHGASGAACPECGVWRWLPLAPEQYPPVYPSPDWEGHPVIASPEWFGDVRMAYRRLLFVRELGELLAKASPRDFELREVAVADQIRE
jgi:hypothetical protein